MIPVLHQHRAEIAALCRQFQVLRLDLFGSAAREVDFDPAARLSAFEHLRLRDLLADLLGRPVDLVTEGAVKNPFVLSGIERSRQPFHAA